MKTRIGLWIDHRRAVVVTVTDHGEDVSRIESGIEASLRQNEGRHANRPSGDDVQQRVLTERQHEYYDTVIAAIRPAEAILILGPGEAKTEFKRRLETHDLGGRVVGVEAADKLTDAQLAARVRGFFAG
jgi:hypothetical protein